MMPHLTTSQTVFLKHRVGLGVWKVVFIEFSAGIVSQSVIVTQYEDLLEKASF